MKFDKVLKMISGAVDCDTLKLVNVLVSMIKNDFTADQYRKVRTTWCAKRHELGYGIEVDWVY